MHAPECKTRLTSVQLGNAVDHPTHYNEHPSGIECVVIAEHMGFNIGNALKYLWRAGLKDGSPTEEDYRKAIWYINREIAKITKEKT
jgi:hypothetical protein